MGQVLVRQLDDQVIQALKQKASRHGHSLEQELRDILIRAAGPSRQEVREQMRATRQRIGWIDADIPALIREGREE